MDTSLSAAEVLTALRVDSVGGRVFWVVPPRTHPRLLGKEAGGQKVSRDGKRYWVVKLNGVPLRRSHLVFLVKEGRWPGLDIDHENGDSLDDRAANLREATKVQNAQNHKRRAKKSELPMGVREVRPGRFQARIACEKQQRSLGVYDCPKVASEVYQQGRRTLFGEFA